MGYNRGKQYVYFNVLPGNHQILSKAENWAGVNIEAKVGEIHYLQQQATYGIVMTRNSIIKIPEDEGKFHLKNSKEGTIIRTEKSQ